jgi:MinD-like ATPase involved in chromosome partitioning or flagellar assembly
MLLALWSPKGGSGTSVLAAAVALVLARGPAGGCRLADLDGDQPAIFGLSSEPELGLADWLAAGPEAPTEALDRFVVEVAPGVALLPLGSSPSPLVARPAAEAGAALAVALRDGTFPVVVDCGRAGDPASRAVAEVADATVVVVRGCYLALRRAVSSAALSSTLGAVVVEEPGRSLSRREIADVLGLPVIARVPFRDQVFRAVDAGVLAARLPDALARAASDVVARIGRGPVRRGAAA